METSRDTLATTWSRKLSSFRPGLERLLTGPVAYRVAILFSEEDPARCHRRLLVTRVLVTRDVEVRDIRGDGPWSPRPS